MFASKKSKTMSQSRRVRISNSSLNCYGTRVLTQGVDIEQYTRNPILLWMHFNPYRGAKDEVLPIGTIKDVHKDGDDIIGELVFDTSDEFAAKIANKWDSGVLKMVSPHFDVIATDDDPALALPGQTRATVTKAKLIEVSVVVIGGNDANMALSLGGERLKLDAGGACLSIPPLRSANQQPNNQPQNPKNMNELELLALKLGLPKEAGVAEVSATIDILLGYKSANETLKSEKEALELAAITQEVDSAIAARKITLEHKDHFVSLGKSSGIETLRLTFGAMASAVKPTEIINPGSGLPLTAPVTATKLSELTSIQLSELRANDKETYMRLYKAEYGVDCPKY